jgi:electron transfer flavoprotein beta subunit
VTMGPPAAVQVLRESLYRGADEVILLTDKAFAGADTLATSYALSLAVQKLGGADLVLCGRQAIDGDTAQVGPQCAEKLGIAQVTYADRVLDYDGSKLTVRRDLGRAKETVEVKLPVLMTVPKSANSPRWPNARLMLKYRRARSAFEVEGEAKAQGRGVDDVVNGLRERGLFIETWGAEDIGADLSRIGISGSPTKVKKVENVVLTGANLNLFNPDDVGVRDLINELIDERTFG